MNTLDRSLVLIVLLLASYSLAVKPSCKQRLCPSLQQSECEHLLKCGEVYGVIHTLPLPPEDGRHGQVKLCLWGHELGGGETRLLR